MTIKDEYIKLYKKLIRTKIDLSYLEERNEELNDMLKNLIRVSDSEKLHDIDIYIGYLPINMINAQVSIGNSGILLLIHEGLSTFTMGTSLLLGNLMPLSFENRILDLDIDIENARKNFQELIISFVKSQPIKYNGSFVHRNRRQEFGVSIYASVLWFVVAHELAHIICDHLNKERTKNMTIGESSVEIFITSWENEMEADNLAIRLLRKLQQNTPIDYIYIGPVVLFEMLESIDSIASALKFNFKYDLFNFPPLSSTHPRPKARRSAIINDTYAPGQVPFTPYLDLVIDMMEQLRRKN